MNELSLQSYDYDLPHAQIATEPLERREDARLLVYYPRTKNIEHHTFDAFESLVPRSHALVINDTKVLKARFFAQKDNGKSVEIYPIIICTQRIFSPRFAAVCAK
ncbi:MAG: S-adenosylmethionine:tRNA ribosyltransferase-isomerase, partial [Helicobacter sp.]|nr:S-adenosylmethionine:tRNA ribosyltransferase-isomerase [Helicobacter sp.]